MTDYKLAVSYRTTNTTGVWHGHVQAESEEAAIEQARAIVRHKHGCKLFRITDTKCEVSGWN